MCTSRIQPYGGRGEGCTTHLGGVYETLGGVYVTLRVVYDTHTETDTWLAYQVRAAPTLETPLFRAHHSRRTAIGKLAVCTSRAYGCTTHLGGCTTHWGWGTTHLEGCTTHLSGFITHLEGCTTHTETGGVQIGRLRGLGSSRRAAATLEASLFGAHHPCRTAIGTLVVCNIGLYDV